MQNEATVSQREETVSERLFAEAIAKKDDSKLRVLAEVLVEEEVRRNAELPNRAFMRGNRARELLEKVPFECEETITFLRGGITEAWLSCSQEEGRPFLEMMWDWSGNNTKRVAGALRMQLDEGSGVGVLAKLIDFLVDGQPPRKEGDELWRTVCKGVGKFACLADMKFLARILRLIAPLPDEVRDLAAKPIVDRTEKMIALAWVAAKLRRSVWHSGSGEIRGENHIALFWHGMGDMSAGWKDRELVPMHNTAKEVRRWLGHHCPDMHIRVDIEVGFCPNGSGFNAEPVEVITLTVET